VVGRPDTQIPLELSPEPASGFDSFIVTDSNRIAVTALRAWPDWPAPTLLLLGPEGTGKTHLGEAWKELSCGTFIDDAERVEEAELFAQMNLALNGEVSGLLLTSRNSLSDWNVAMPDLKSRLSSTPVMVMDDYDEGDLEPLLRQLFENRGRQVTKDLVDYLLKYESREVGALRNLVRRLDEAALAEKADLTKYFAAQYLSGRLERDLFSGPVE
jgi:chromosomal replication initiation ATPase DnaA